MLYLPPRTGCSEARRPLRRMHTFHFVARSFCFMHSRRSWLYHRPVVLSQVCGAILDLSSLWSWDASAVADKRLLRFWHWDNCAWELFLLFVCATDINGKRYGVAVRFIASFGVYSVVICVDGISYWFCVKRQKLLFVVIGSDQCDFYYERR